MFFSPLSIEMLFGLILPGTQGKSQEALLRVLEINEEEINGYLAELQIASESLLGMVNPDEYNPDFTTVQLANSLWHHTDTEIQAHYARMMNTRFPFEWFHFSHPVADTTPRINQWASDKTNGLIPELPIALDKNSVAVLLSALYLKGFWSREFSHIANDTDVFYKLDGSEGVSQYMEITQDTDEGQAEAYYLKKESFHALRLMLNDKRIGLEVYLPHEKTGLNDFIDQLPPGNFEQWKDEFVPAPYFYFLMPKFETEDGFKLGEIAEQLGLDALFTLSNDLAPMLQSQELLQFSDIGQKAKIKVTKEGLEAAAVGYAVGVAGAAFYEEPETQEMIVFEADHPFLYRIVDTVTNQALFQGIFTTPVHTSDIFLEHLNKRTRKAYDQHCPELSDQERFVVALLLLETTLEKYPLTYNVLKEIVDRIWANLAKDETLRDSSLAQDYTDYLTALYYIKNKEHEDEDYADDPPQNKFIEVAEEINDSLLELFNDFGAMLGERVVTEYNIKSFGYFFYLVIDNNVQLPNYRHLISLIRQHQKGHVVRRIAFADLQFDEIPKTIEYTEEEKQARVALRTQQEVDRKMSRLGKSLKAGFATYALTRLRSHVGESYAAIDKVIHKLEQYVLQPNQAQTEEIRSMLYWISHAGQYDTHSGFDTKDRLQVKLLRKKFPDVMAMLAIVGAQFIDKSNWDILDEINRENKESEILAKANDLLAKHGLLHSTTLWRWLLLCRTSKKTWFLTMLFSKVSKFY